MLTCKCTVCRVASMLLKTGLKKLNDVDQVNVSLQSFAISVT